MMYRNFILVYCLTFSLQYTQGQDDNFSAQHKQLDSLFNYIHTNGLYNGYATISNKEGILFEKSYGTTLPNDKTTISRSTPFLLASLSKQFTAMAIIYLYSKSKLSYDDYVVKYLPEFPYDKITIRHLLNHTSGLKEYTNVINAQREYFQKDYEENGRAFTNTTLANYFTKTKPTLDFEPGTSFHYSNTGYVYLALIIEQISQLSYANFLHQNFFEPIGMKNTFAITDLNSDIKAIKSYREDPITLDNEIVNQPSFFKIVGDGGLFSSNEDLLKWFTAIDKGQIVDQKFLKDAYSTPANKEGNLPYGFGWFVRNHPLNDHKILTHSGEFLGFTNSVFRDIDQGLTFVSLSNNSHQIKGDLNAAVIRILYGLPFKLPKLNAEKMLIQTILKGGINKVKEIYESEKELDNYDFSERIINRIGYNLLQADYLQEAKAIFIWNTELYPTSGNVYDSLGEIYLLLGDEKKAALNYQKAIALDEKNENAIKILEKINQKDKD